MEETDWPFGGWDMERLIKIRDSPNIENFPQERKISALNYVVLEVKQEDYYASKTLTQNCGSKCFTLPLMIFSSLS